MSKDDLECECMNELFGRNETMIAQVYVKSDEDNTALIVARDNTVYFQDVIDVPEITGIQRAVSFVKHHLDVDKTEIYTDKLNVDEVLKDVYINYCKVNVCKGNNPNPKMVKAAESSLAVHNRWCFRGGRNE